MERSSVKKPPHPHINGTSSSLHICNQHLATPTITIFSFIMSCHFVFYVFVQFNYYDITHKLKMIAHECVKHMHVELNLIVMPQHNYSDAAGKPRDFKTRPAEVRVRMDTTYSSEL